MLQQARDFVALYWPWITVTFLGALINALIEVPEATWTAWAAVSPRRRAAVALVRKIFPDPRGTGKLVAQLLTAKAATLPKPKALEYSFAVDTTELDDAVKRAVSQRAAPAPGEPRSDLTALEARDEEPKP